MSSFFERGGEAVRHERAISSLSDDTGASLARVRRLFALELARLELSAKVRTYLSVLTTSNVRALLRRKVEPPRAAETSQLAAQVNAWEDEGGTTASRCSLAAQV
jgi:hypothetical protein